MFNQHSLFTRFEHTLKAAQQGKRQDHPSILALLKIAAKQIGQRPDIGG